MSEVGKFGYNVEFFEDLGRKLIPRLTKVSSFEIHVDEKPYFAKFNTTYFNVNEDNKLIMTIKRNGSEVQKIFPINSGLIHKNTAAAIARIMLQEGQL